MSTWDVSDDFIRSAAEAASLRMSNIQLCDVNTQPRELIDVVKMKTKRLAIARIITPTDDEHEYILIVNSKAFNPDEIIVLRKLLSVHRTPPHTVRKREISGGTGFVFSAMESLTCWTSEEAES